MPFFGSKKKSKAKLEKSAGSQDSGHGAQNESSSSSQHRRGQSGGGILGRVNAGPGAFSVGDKDSQSTAVFRVTVPDNVSPGEEFQVYAGNRIVRVRCPVDSRPGQSLQITVPVDPNETNANSNGPGGVAAAQGPGAGVPGGDLPPDSPNVQRLEGQAGPDGRPAYMVTIPHGVRGGQQFPVTIAGQQLMVTCPPNARPGMSVRIVPPAPPPGVQQGSSLDRGSGGPAPRRRINKPPDGTQMFEVVVPKGVAPGQPFALLAGGVRVLVTCPTNASSGQKIRFNLPTALLQKKTDGDSLGKLAKIKLSYDKDGWTRTVRVTDLKFQWVRMDDNGDVDNSNRFDIKHSAYVRHLVFREGVDPRMRTGTLTLVKANDPRAVVDSRIKGLDGKTDLVSYSHIANVQDKSFEDKVHWFQDTCAQLCVEWNEGHMRMNVRREYLLSDSMEAVMSLSRKDLRKVWRFEFIGEQGIDAGGLAREWFQLVTEEIFDPDMGLWQSCATNQMCMQINPASEIACPEDHLIYFRFLGRVMGKALFDRQLVAGHMVQHLYKQLLGWPLLFNDLETVDEDYYKNLKKLAEMNPEEVEYLCLDFTTTEETMGDKKVVHLVPNGDQMEVQADNLPEYFEACLKYKLNGQVKAQLNELLLGFFDVIPEPLLTIFDFQELELLMCGLPEIDIDDWRDNSEYSGEYDRVGSDHETCRWFWEVVEEFDQEMRARLLQFVTGTSGVPSRGFGVLQGNDGNIRRFTIHGVELGVCLYPRAHTCFNRIDLPMYEEKQELKEKLELAVTMVSTGFDLE
uniref:HECT-type E3 ubiquitin transferase n=1 Tax=Odontella aurita TaxID=265563 RepID=A0A7S4II14_9STRA|mmetsp:Transcript_25441/g.74929  ORF Transcript_25441/g.74929 Transcript_25441/m.74929 type:complete len:794 (+) Transcript_25441:436-2817(+)